MRELNKCIPSLKPWKKEEIKPLKILPMEIPLKQCTNNCDRNSDEQHMKICPEDRNFVCERKNKINDSGKHEEGKKIS